MCKFSSKSGGVPFQISFFLGDLTRNDPEEIFLQRNTKAEGKALIRDILNWFIWKSIFLKWKRH